MDELEPGTAAMELPPVRSAAGARAPWYRRLTALSGTLLFACMFLPAFNACGQPLRPYEAPPALPPYVYGLVLALIAISRTPRALRLGIVALRALAVLAMVASVVVFFLLPPFGVLLLIVGAMLLSLVGRSGPMESGVAASGVAVAVLSMIWFGILSVFEDALLGVYLSLASSTGLFASALLWARALAACPPVDLPAAVARRRE